MKSDSSVSAPSLQHDEQIPQNSMVSESQEPPGNSTALLNESSRKNLELLRSILIDYSAVELEQEIFTLNEVTVHTVKPQKQSRKSSKQQSTAEETG
jgi:hypothetical protein